MQCKRCRCLCNSEECNVCRKQLYPRECRTVGCTHYASRLDACNSCFPSRPLLVPIRVRPDQSFVKKYNASFEYLCVFVSQQIPPVLATIILSYMMTTIAWA